MPDGVDRVYVVEVKGDLTFQVFERDGQLSVDSGWWNIRSVDALSLVVLNAPSGDVVEDNELIEQIFEVLPDEGEITC